MKKVAVVILNWNGKKLLEQFLPSVIKYSNPNFADIIVADNASKDDSVALVRKKFPEIQIIQLDKNYGFAEGYNQTLKQITHPYTLLLNSDVEVTPNWLEPLLELMESDRQIGAIQPKIKAQKQKDHFEYAGAAGGFIDYLGYPFCRGRILDHIEPDYGQYDQIREVFWASGAALLVNTRQYLEVGGLDSDFFAHMEEIDLCWRLKNRGFRILCQPESTVFHLGGGTLPNNSPRKLFLNFRNNLLMIYKNTPSEKILRTLFTRMLLDGVAAIKFLTELEFANFCAVFRAHFSFYSLLDKTRAKREKLLTSVLVKSHKEIYTKSIVFAYYFKRRKNFSDLKF